MKRYVLLVFLLLLCPVFLAGSAERKKDDPWVSMTERVRIWDDVVAKELNLSLPLSEPKPYTVSSNGLEATFEKDGTKWTIIGANAPIVNPTVYPKDWPVKGSDFEVLVIPEPITNYKILPFTEKIENAVRSGTVSVTGAPDSYEPASFVIRSGDADLKDVMVEVTDLKAQVVGKDGKKRTVVFPKENIDIRLVKCWYQAGVAINDTTHKLLTPELLLHDDEVVHVDDKIQVNMVRDLAKVEEAERLVKFVMPKGQNKQVWLTLHFTEDIPAGKYQGMVDIGNGQVLKSLRLEVRVLPFTLPEPMLEYALYYESRLQEDRGSKIYKNFRTEKQMLYELQDMKAHGLTNATVWHVVDEDETKWDDDWKILKKTLELRKKIGWGEKALLYLDWRTKFKVDFIGKSEKKKKIGQAEIEEYKRKIRKVIEIAKTCEIKDVYIYGIDERKGKDLLDLRPYYRAVHEVGGKNFVAALEDFLLFIPDLLDLPVLYVPDDPEGNPGRFYMKILEKLGIRAWNYGNPQAGLEMPATYRLQYGRRLLLESFSGTCNYTYQQGWNDFKSQKYRSHTMAYPTVNKPIPTIQWEGWREGVNDVRYLTLLDKRNIILPNFIEAYCSEKASDCRNNVIGHIQKRSM